MCVAEFALGALDSGGVLFHRFTETAGDETWNIVWVLWHSKTRPASTWRNVHIKPLEKVHHMKQRKSDGEAERPVGRPVDLHCKLQSAKQAQESRTQDGLDRSQRERTSQSGRSGSNVEVMQGKARQDKESYDTYAGTLASLGYSCERKYLGMYI